ncbi:MAG: S9 family peptidase [Fimbriimonadaceae bacterium]|nr:S9 family peptidase [Fimbriimonadaceae bacterium]
MRRQILLSFLAVAAVVAAAPVLAGQQPKKILDPSVWDGWKSVQNAGLSRTGKWMMYRLSPQSGDAELVVMSTAGGTTYKTARATGVRITRDEKFAVMTIVPPKADVDKARQEKKPAAQQPKNSLGIMDLSNGNVTLVEKLRSFRMADKDNGWIAYQLEPPAPPAGAAGGGSARPGGGGGGTDQEPANQEPKQEEKKEESKKRRNHTVGSEVILRELATANEVKIADVSSFTFTEDGSLLVYATSTKDGAGDGVFLRDMASGTTTEVVKGLGVYRSLGFDKKKSQIAFVSDKEDYKPEQSSVSVFVYDIGRKSLRTVAKEGTQGIPRGWWVSPNSNATFSESGKRLIISTVSKPGPEVKDETPEEDRVSVDIWNWKDPLLMPQQLKQTQQVLNKTYDAVVYLDSGRVLQLETEEMPNVSIGNQNDADVAIGVDPAPYQQLISWDQGYQDIYKVNLRNNERTLLLRKSATGVSLSPSAKYGLYFDENKGHWFVIDMASGKSVNITVQIPNPVYNVLNDVPAKAGPEGSGGWIDDDKGVLIYDQFDIWLCDPTGKAAPKNITNELGRWRQWELRIIRTDTEDRDIDPNKPLLLRMTDTQTMATGFFTDTVAGDAYPEKLLLEDKNLGFADKATEGDQVLMTRGTFTEYPNLWLTDMTFKNQKQVSDANPQQKEYNWGTTEIVRWTSTDGQKMSGVLVKPENFDPSKKYPMIVYFYERSLNQLHNHRVPAPSASVINPTEYASNGYLVFMPDIVYRDGYPGESAEQCILSGTAAVIDRGYVDPKRVGVQGQSWGGYQAAFLITRTRMFAAACAGAPVVNMFSAYGGIRWGSGLVRQMQYEQGQSRIGGTMWEKPLQYIENSPIFWVDKIETPLLMMNNDQDGAVPYWQGIEMFTAMRRLGKPAWLFVYNGEDHNLVQRKNRKDWSVRMLQFFDYYLKDGPAPVWLIEGVPAVKKGKTMGTETVPPKKGG